jgi:hypothetical protein
LKLPFADEKNKTRNGARLIFQVVSGKEGNVFKGGAHHGEAVHLAFSKYTCTDFKTHIN